MSSRTAVPDLVKPRTFLGHPIGLYVLFFTEMWERFSYYGMRALLILYMVNYFKWSQKEASTIYKVYTSFVYVTPILGGFLADRWLGNRMAVIIGAILMAIGHFLMAFEEYPIFMGALIFLILGNGFFKPNMSTQVGRLYPANDGRRDGAYTIFYMGINLGAFLAPLVCGWLADNTMGGYHTGFTMAGIGMVAGLVIYLFGQPLLHEIPPDTGADRAVSPSGDAGLEPLSAPAKEGGVESFTTHPPRAEGVTAEPGQAPAVEGVTGQPPRAEAVTARPSAAAAPPPAEAKGQALSEAEAERAPSSLGFLAAAAPLILAILGGVLLLAAPALFLLQRVDLWDGIMLAIGGGCLALIAFVGAQVRGGLRDRILAILTLGVFVMFFWAAFEQAGNVLNIWADKHTNRYLTQPMQPPPIKPEKVEEAAAKGSEEKAEPPARPGFFMRFAVMFQPKPRPAGEPEFTWGGWFTKFFNPVSTASFQSINALAIFVLAPAFAFLWIWLDRRGWQPSIPMKMVLGLLMMSASMAVMIAAARSENQFSEVAFSASQLPEGLTLEDGKLARFKRDKDGKRTSEVEVFHAGRLAFNAETKTFELYGVLPDNEKDLIIEETAPEAYRRKVEELKKASVKINDEIKEVSVTLDEIPPGFDWSYTGLKTTVVRFNENSRTLTAFQPLADKEVKALLLAAGEPVLRDTINKLFVESNTFRVSSWWLFWSYILATLGELCLSPVGLSMVSKLSPAKYATMLMGVWLLTSAFGNFAAGALGEIWGTIPPIQFFMLSTAVVGGAAVVLFLLVRLVVGTMHGVK